MNRHKIDDRFLTSVGFVKLHSTQPIWVWGSYTKEGKHIPIIEWSEETTLAYASPINFSKIIKTIHGMDQFINNVNFLMSTEN